MEDTVSPRVLAKIVYSGSSAASFVEASNHLAELANVEISPERVRRACGRVALDRIEHHQRLQEAYQSKPLPEQSCGRPADVAPPEIACVMADGGRYQHLDRSLPASGQQSARKGEHWKESRIGLLASMSGAQHETDPQPDLPPELRYVAIAETLSEIGKTGSKCESPADDNLLSASPELNFRRISAGPRGLGDRRQLAVIVAAKRRRASVQLARQTARKKVTAGAFDVSRAGLDLRQKRLI